MAARDSKKWETLVAPEVVALGESSIPREGEILFGLRYASSKFTYEAVF